MVTQKWNAHEDLLVEIHARGREAEWVLETLGKRLPHRPGPAVKVEIFVGPIKEQS